MVTFKGNAVVILGEHKNKDVQVTAQDTSTCGAGISQVSEEL